jgi:hypothetical protein
VVEANGEIVKMAYPVLKALTHCRIWGKVFLDGLVEANSEIVKEGEKNKNYKYYQRTSQSIKPKDLL